MKKKNSKTSISKTPRPTMEEVHDPTLDRYPPIRIGTWQLSDWGPRNPYEINGMMRRHRDLEGHDEFDE